MRYFNLVLAWIELHPVFFVVIAWPIITMVVNAAFKHRTPEELDKLPVPVAGLLRFLRATGLDAKPALALVWGALTRQKVPMPEIAPPKDGPPPKA